MMTEERGEVVKSPITPIDIVGRAIELNLIEDLEFRESYRRVEVCPTNNKIISNEASRSDVCVICGAWHIAIENKWKSHLVTVSGKWVRKIPQSTLDKILFFLGIWYKKTFFIPLETPDSLLEEMSKLPDPTSSDYNERISELALSIITFHGGPYYDQ